MFGAVGASKFFPSVNIGKTTCCFSAQKDNEKGNTVAFISHLLQVLNLFFFLFGRVLVKGCL